ncbi:restriction endonuclease subunit S [Pseudomonas sp. Ga0074129]|uniref:restriction endonuclease subunit S n=1 Tax=Pseudomonas sp. Ga0074129 TaxID=1752219 RepID=UPI000B2E34AB|nr:restriction endonuclease subunit S [Pseudomonas sp. Ga0074129]
MNKLPAGWKLSRLEELATVERGKFSARPRNDPKFFGGDIPFVQTGEVSAAGTYLINHKQTLNELGKTVSKVFPKDSILITIAANIGETAITTYEVACPDSVVAIIPKPAKAHVFWLKKVLETLKDDLDSKATQNAQKNINLEVLRPLEIATPPIEEQTKIAQILSAWDKAITTTERLLANSQQQKQALVQQLLTGQKRFAGLHGNWQIADFPSLFLVKNDKKTQTISSNYLEQGKTPVVDQGQALIAGYTDSDQVYRDVPVIVFGDHTRAIKWVDFEFSPGADGTQILKASDLLEARFAYYLLSNADIPNLGYSRHMRELKEIEFRYPTDKAEQQKIAQVLSTADAEVANLQAQLATLKLEKKALMQQLLTGQRRVKPDADAAA